MDKLANAVVMTSQGVPFLHAGSEMLRTKNEEHNSYNLPDSVNQIDWNWKVKNKGVVEYYKNLIALRKEHPAFRMTSGDEVREHLVFKREEEGLISYEISDHANGDSWKNILVIYNAKDEPVDFKLTENWLIGFQGDNFNLHNGENIQGSIKVSPISMIVLYQK